MRTPAVFAVPLVFIALTTGNNTHASSTQQSAATPSTSAALAIPAESSADWFRKGALRAHAQGAGKTPARNLILFIGDGMSLTTITAARIFEGQRRGESGEENVLSFEHFPHTALSKTYNTDFQTPDSAGTMTAIASGVKTRMGMIGVGPEAARGDCIGSRKTPLVSLVELAEHAGLGTGLVTTTRITHATPAALFGHSPERQWESDAELSESARMAGCADLAQQLVEFPHGDGIEVLLGGGRGKFLPATTRDPEHRNLRGERKDGRNLIAEWEKRHPQGAFVWNQSQLAAVADRKPRQLFGLFEHGHMRYEHERGDDAAGEPSLAEMTRQAIAMLSQHPAGYVLMIEAGRIDHAHHEGNAYRALLDTLALSDAVSAARELSNDDTLILVTADHSHTLNLIGYPKRGNPILGKVRDSSGEDPNQGFAKDGFGMPYTTLVYANGPGHAGATDDQPAGPKKHLHTAKRFLSRAHRPDLTKVDTEHPDYLQDALVPLDSETHGGDDVGVWASGPGADAVRGTFEQNVIFHLLAQSQPRLRTLLCDIGSCDAEGVPVGLPDTHKLTR